MTIDTKTVAKIAKLARIRVSVDEQEHFAKEINGILQWVEQLQEVNTDGVPQMTSVCDVKLPWREDKVTDGGVQEKILFNAPKSAYGCFSVPKVIE